MFDGADPITLIGHDVRRALALYVDHLGFEVAERGPLLDPSRWRAVWHLPGSAGLDAWMLIKSGSHGGSLRLVRDPDAPDTPAPRGIARIGPYALDFYVRDLDALHAELTQAGYAFRSPPQRYQLFGTEFAVHEAILDAPLGLVHAFVEYLPDRHRCVLANAPEARCSEVVTVVHGVSEVQPAVAFVTELLGAHVSLDEVFRGPAVENLLDLAAGASFRMTLLRSTSRGNARLEFIESCDGGEPASNLVVGAIVENIVTLAARARTVPGVTVSETTRLHGPGAPRRSVGLVTNWGARFELAERS